MFCNTSSDAPCKRLRFRLVHSLVSRSLAYECGMMEGREKERTSLLACIHCQRSGWWMRRLASRCSGTAGAQTLISISTHLIPFHHAFLPFKLLLFIRFAFVGFAPSAQRVPAQPRRVLQAAITAVFTPK
jgi:hypothetical protein